MTSSKWKLGDRVKLSQKGWHFLQYSFLNIENKEVYTVAYDRHNNLPMIFIDGTHFKLGDFAHKNWDDYVESASIIQYEPVEGSLP